MLYTIETYALYKAERQREYKKDSNLLIVSGLLF